MSHVPLWKPILFGALAGAMGWGIRGQYGHETGAMLPGMLVSLALALLILPQAPSHFAIRAVALGAIAMGFGGSMTYGQTVGLTHDSALVGNWDALRWGMLGLAIKGGLWIGFAGAFLGLALSGIRYRAIEFVVVLSALLLLCWAGSQLLNEPFDPENRILPRFYFSDDWRWEPGADLTPRREVWGGLLLAFIGLLSYLGALRKDPLAPRLALWGLLGGAIGFPLGQSIQAFHAWNPELFRSGAGLAMAPVMNWWNWMETTFGAVMGATLGLGLWLNRRRISPDPSSPVQEIPPWAASSLLVIHVALLTSVEFLSIPLVDRLYDFGIMLAFIPIVCVLGAPQWRYWIFPITLLPIAGKTVRELVYRNPAIDPFPGFLLYLLLPLAAAILLAVRLQRPPSAAKTTIVESRSSPDTAPQPSQPSSSPAFPHLALMLLATTWIAFLLNFAFFRFPWPWETWTARTPNSLVYLFCTITLTYLAVTHARSSLSVPH